MNLFSFSNRPYPLGFLLGNSVRGTSLRRSRDGWGVTEGELLVLVVAHERGLTAATTRLISLVVTADNLDFCVILGTDNTGEFPTHWDPAGARAASQQSAQRTQWRRRERGEQPVS